MHVGDPALDSATFDTSGLASGQAPAQVRAALGAPPIVFDLGPDATVWSFPVRMLPHGRMRVRAALLKVRFDDDDRVADWGFFHPVSGTPLGMHESAAAADAWREEIRKTMCFQLPRIDLATVLAAGTPREDVVKAMRWFPEPASTARDRGFVTVAREQGRTVLWFHADRPSPLFIPSFDFEVEFSKSTQRVTHSWLDGWGGCE